MKKNNMPVVAVCASAALLTLLVVVGGIEAKRIIDEVYDILIANNNKSVVVLSMSLMVEVGVCGCIIVVGAAKQYKALINEYKKIRSQRG